MGFDNENLKKKLGGWIIGIPDCDSILQEAGILDKCDIITGENLEQRLNHIESILKTNSDDVSRSFLIGAVGELKTLRALMNLKGDFVILNGVQLMFYPPFFDREHGNYVCTSQIDHVVVGSTGIFAIESKNWSANTYTRMMQAAEYSPLDQARRAAKSLWLFIERRAHLKYSLPVKAVLSLSGSARFKGNRRVRVVPVKSLYRFISRPRSYRNSLSVEEIKEVVYCLADEWLDP